MAKLTGQFTTPSLDAQNNKTHKPFQHGVVFIFTGATKVVKETDSKGKYSFDLANGEYEVSVYLKGNTEKDRFDMRAGEKFQVTATTKADALEKWLQVIGNNGKDELAAYYENLLAQMQKLYEDTKAIRDEMKEKVVGDGPRYMLEGAGGWLYRGATTLSLSDSETIDFFREKGSQVYRNSEPTPYNAGRTFSPSLLVSSSTSYANLSVNFVSGEITVTSGNLSTEKITTVHSTANTTVDSNGNIKTASPIIKLFNDHIESNDSFKEKPVFEKLGMGVYKISNTLGLAKEGWYIETPKDKNGLPYFMVDWEQDEESQDVIIRVFKKKLDLETLDFVNGDPVDIGKDQRWIDLRFHEEPQKADDEELLIQLDSTLN